jgi:hypothetical protein
VGGVVENHPRDEKLSVSVVHRGLMRNGRSLGVGRCVLQEPGWSGSVEYSQHTYTYSYEMTRIFSGQIPVDSASILSLLHHLHRITIYGSLYPRGH